MVMTEAFFTDLESRLKAEVKSDIQQELVDRLIKIMATALNSLTIPPAKISFDPDIYPSPVPVEVNVPTPSVYVTNEVDLSALIDALQQNTISNKELAAAYLRPIKRTVHRAGDNIDYMIEERL